MMGISFYLIWKQNWKTKELKTAGLYFFAQLFLNFIWSPVFFGLRNPVLGLVVIVALWFVLLVTMKKFYSLSRNAFYLLVPYLVWVSFATVLNFAIVVLN